MLIIYTYILYITVITVNPRWEPAASFFDVSLAFSRRAEGLSLLLPIFHGAVEKTGRSRGRRILPPVFLPFPPVFPRLSLTCPLLGVENPFLPSLPGGRKTALFPRKIPPSRGKFPLRGGEKNRASTFPLFPPPDFHCAQNTENPAARPKTAVFHDFHRPYYGLR